MYNQKRLENPVCIIRERPVRNYILRQAMAQIDLLVPLNCPLSFLYHNLGDDEVKIFKDHMIDINKDLTIRALEFREYLLRLAGVRAVSDLDNMDKLKGSILALEDDDQLTEYIFSNTNKAREEYTKYNREE